MKKISTALLLFSSSILVSCKKQVILEKGKPELRSTATTVNVFRSDNTSLTDLLVFPDDVEYERVDMARYALANALKSIITPQISQYIYNRCADNERNVVSLDQVFQTYPTLLTALNENLQNQSITQIPYDFSSYSKIVSALSKNGINYSVSLHISNISVASSSYSAILTPGIEVPEESDHADQIFGWLIDASGITAVKIDEAEAENTDHPLLTVSLEPSTATAGPDGPWTVPPYLNPWEENGQETRFAIRELIVYSRFEKTGNSSVCMGGALYTKGVNGTWSHDHTIAFNWYWLTYRPNQHDYLEVASISKNNIAKWVTPSVMGMSNFPIVPFLARSGWPTNSIQTQYYVWNTYERDWWESGKEIAWTGTPSSPVAIWGDRTFADETYFYNRHVCNPGSQWTISTNSSNVVYNSTTDVFATGNYKSEMKFYKKVL